MQISFTDRVLPTIRCTDQILRGEVSPCRLKITAAYAFISSSSRFCPSLTGLAVCVGKECRATAEMTLKIVRCVDVWSLMTLSLQVDLVLSDVAATVSHNLFNRCSVILHTVMQ